MKCFQKQNGLIHHFKIDFVINTTTIYTLLGSVRWKLFSAVGDIQHVRVKRCPFCRNLIEKHTGCNYMFCICQKAFCWDCLQDYNKHDYSKCRVNQKKLQVRFVVWKKKIDVPNITNSLRKVLNWTNLCMNFDHQILKNRFSVVMVYWTKIIIWYLNLIIGSVRWKLLSGGFGDIQHVRVKRCPFCHNFIEKSYGCPHMECICGREFCWDCQQDYLTHDYLECRRKQHTQLKVSLQLCIIPVLSGCRLWWPKTVCWLVL